MENTSLMKNKCEYMIVTVFIIIFCIVSILCVAKNDDYLDTTIYNDMGIGVVDIETFMANNMDDLYDLYHINHINHIDDTDNIDNVPQQYSLISNEIKRMNIANIIKISNNIKKIIIDRIMKYGVSCQSMNGAEYQVFANINLTLTCITDPYSIEEDILLDITEYITNVLKNKYNINISPYIVITDLRRVLNLNESLIYPLQYSHLYTIHGAQYFTRQMLVQLVNTNIKIKNALQTILSRQGIIIED